MQRQGRHDIRDEIMVLFLGKENVVAVFFCDGEREPASESGPTIGRQDHADAYAKKQRPSTQDL